MTKALLFDLGGVLVDIDFQLAFEQFEMLSRLDQLEIKNRFQMDQAYRDHEIGKIEWPEYASHLRYKLELDAIDDDIANAWNAIFKDQITETINMIKQINTDIDCFMFSNTNTKHHEYWSHKYPQVTSLFKQVFVSSELNLRKPDVEAFEAVCRSTGYQSKDFIFFDDTQENIDGAISAGLDAVLVNGSADVIRKLKKLEWI